MHAATMNNAEKGFGEFSEHQEEELNYERLNLDSEMEDINSQTPFGGGN